MLERGCRPADGLFITPAVRTDELLRDDFNSPGWFVFGADLFEKHALLETVARDSAKHFVLFRREAPDDFFGRDGWWFRLIDRHGSRQCRGSCRPHRARAGVLRMHATQPCEKEYRDATRGDHGHMEWRFIECVSIRNSIGCNPWPLCSVGFLTQSAICRAPRVCVRTAKA